MNELAPLKGLSLFFIILLSCNAFSQTEEEKQGAKVFYTYCTLCHGPQGMGEGPLPNLIAEYPDVSLHSDNKFVTFSELKTVISEGSMLDNVSQYMPPFREELSEKQANDVVAFIQFLRGNKIKGSELLKHQSNLVKPDIQKGKVIYKNYCARCHGVEGKGDGKMKKIVNQPPPFDLTKSSVNEEYVQLIITRGGQFLGRSFQMPPWKDELSDQEIRSVSKFILTFRKEIED